MSTNKTPSPETITLHQLATLANLTPRRIGQLGDEGKIPKADNGKLPMVPAIQALFAYYQRDAEQMSREKLLKTAAERRMAERKDRELAASQSKEWFPTATMLQMFRMVVNRFEQLPGKVRSEVGANETYERILQKHVDDVRRQIAADLAELKEAQ